MLGFRRQRISEKNSAALPSSEGNGGRTDVSVSDSGANAHDISASAVLDIQGGIIRGAKITCSRNGTRFWELPDAEAFVIGWKPNRAAFELAAEQSIFGVGLWSRDRFQIDLYVRKIANALELAARMARI